MPRAKADHRHRVMSWDAAKVSRTWRPKTRAKRSRTHQPSQDAERASQDAVAATASQDAMPTSRDAQSVPGRSRHVLGREQVRASANGTRGILGHSERPETPKTIPDARGVFGHASDVPGRLHRPKTPIQRPGRSKRPKTPIHRPRTIQAS